MLKAVAMLFIYLFEMLIAFLYLSKIYERKKSVVQTICIGTLLFLPAVVLFNLFENEVLNAVVFIAINIAFPLLCYEINLQYAAIQGLILSCIMSSTEMITVFLITGLFDVPVNFYKNNIDLFFLLALVARLLYLLISLLAATLFRKFVRKSSGFKSFLPIFMVPLLNIVTCLVFLYLSGSRSIPQNVRIAIIILNIAYVIMCVLLFIYYQVSSENREKLQALAREQQSAAVNAMYLDVLQHQNDELQMVFHSTKHHYLALSSMENMEEVRSYIQSIYPDLENSNTVSVSGNKLLNLILSKYMVLCNKNDIKFTCEVQTADLEYLEDNELSLLLNTILDNAFEAALQSREKVIEFSLRHIQNMDMLSVVNSCDKPPLHSGKRLFTTKGKAYGHGYGSRIIEKHAAMNNGEYEWFYDKDAKRFHLSILFQRQSTAQA